METIIKLREPPDLLQDVLSRLRVAKGPDARGEYVAWCVFHPDGQGKAPHQANLNVSERGYCCHACGATGSLAQLAAHFEVGNERPPQTAETVYDYKDETGTLLYQVIRKPGKKFVQRRPNGKGGWAWNLKDTRRVIYRLPEILARPHEILFVVEGEKDVDRLMSLGLLATTNSGGAGKWRHEFSSYLKDRQVIIIPDNDEPGMKHAHAVAKSAEAFCKSVKILILPNLPPKGDVSDWLNAGSKAEDLLPLVEACPDGASENHIPDDSLQGKDPVNSKTSVPARIIGLLEAEGIILFHDQRGEPYARVILENGPGILGVQSKAFKRYVSGLVWKTYGMTISETQLTSFIRVLESRACFEGPQYTLQSRCAWHEGALWIDLDGHRAVKITPENWSLIDNPPILFRSSPQRKPLPVPVPGGKLCDLLVFLNIKDQPSEILLLSYLVAVIASNGPVPILIIHGVQGSAKSTTMRMLKRLIDPGTPELQSTVKHEGELALLAWYNRVLFFDNISGLPIWFSDALCRLVTGQGLGKRTLYADEDCTVFESRNAVGLSGINQVASKPDLLDRALIIELDPILPGQRRCEEDLWIDFEKKLPALFSGLLDALVKAMAVHPTIEMHDLPRMADFAKWGMAAAVALGYSQEEFLAAFKGNTDRQVSAALEDSLVAQAVIYMMAECPDGWSGSPSCLLESLNKIAEKKFSTKAKEWPTIPSVLSRRLNEVKPALRAQGIEVTSGSRTSSSRMVTITRVDSGDSKPGEAATSGSGDGIMTPELPPDMGAVIEQPHTAPDLFPARDGNDGSAPTASPLPSDPDSWPDDLRQIYEERAAIMEFEGGLPRSQAEREAAELIRRRHVLPLRH